jgi:tetratricopeptide (TPR) repeat protein
MASDEKSAQPVESQPSRRDPLTPAKRKRLQKIFEHAGKQLAQENYDYASELFEQCVLGDPSNLIYVQNYIGNLQKKYNNNKTGSKLAQFKERGSRSAAKKALGHGEWDEVIKHGLKVLAVNPWDVPTLTAMATASENSGDDEVELYYLKCALDANPKDPNVNRQCAHALAARAQFDQAIACWHRVEQIRPGDEEAQHQIARLAVEKTIVKGGYDDKDEAKKLAGDRKAQPQLAQRELSAEERLQQKIDQGSAELSHYLELAQFHINKEEYQSAEEVFAKAYEVSGGDPDVRERWQDTELRHLRQKIARTKDEQERKTYIRQFHEKDLLVHQERCERYPHNLSFRFDLGLRYQKMGQYNEAIREYQQARNDPGRKGRCMLQLGQCFEAINQQRLAMTHYESAIKEIPDREEEHKKDALYRAAKLAMALDDLDAAEAHLTHLAELDFAYRDVSAKLDAIVQLRKKKEPPATQEG